MSGYHRKKVSRQTHPRVYYGITLTSFQGLDLADEYSMRAWIEALLDPQPIEKGTKDSNATIATPPRFKLPGRDESFPVPQLSASTMRKRELRSASPGKAGTTPAGRKIASPRKRKTKAQKEAEAQSPAKAASSALRNAVENGAPESSVEPTPSAASDTAKEDTIQVEVQETSEVVDGVETTHTNVKVVMPADNPDLELPTDAEGVIEKAHEIAETARKLQESKGKSLKRKADDMEDEEEVTSEPLAVQPVKKQRVLEDQLKKERVKARALIGITATLAIGYVWISCISEEALTNTRVAQWSHTSSSQPISSHTTLCNHLPRAYPIPHILLQILSYRPDFSIPHYSPTFGSGVTGAYLEIGKFAEN